MEKELEKLKVERFGLLKLAAYDSQIAYYTGLPSYCVFRGSFSFLEPSLNAIHGKRGQVKHLDKRLFLSDEILMVLMRLSSAKQLKINIQVWLQVCQPCISAFSAMDIRACCPKF